jgi:hypothetical protein
MFKVSVECSEGKMTLRILNKGIRCRVNLQVIHRDIGHSGTTKFHGVDSFPIKWDHRVLCYSYFSLRVVFLTRWMS